MDIQLTSADEADEKDYMLYSGTSVEFDLGGSALVLANRIAGIMELAAYAIPALNHCTKEIAKAGFVCTGVTLAWVNIKRPAENGGRNRHRRIKFEISGPDSIVWYLDDWNDEKDRTYQGPDGWKELLEYFLAQNASSESVLERASSLLIPVGPAEIVPSVLRETAVPVNQLVRELAKSIAEIEGMAVHGYDDMWINVEIGTLELIVGVVSSPDSNILTTTAQLSRKRDHRKGAINTSYSDVDRFVRRSIGFIETYPVLLTMLDTAAAADDRFHPMKHNLGLEFAAGGLVIWAPGNGRDWTRWSALAHGSSEVRDFEVDELDEAIAYVLNATS